MSLAQGYENIAAQLEELLKKVRYLEQKNAEMQHDLMFTEGLYASDKADFSHPFRIAHTSLKRENGA